MYRECDTILNIGLNDFTYSLIASITQNYYLAFDLYRTFLKQFGSVVLKVDSTRYDTITQQALTAHNVHSDKMLPKEVYDSIILDMKAIAYVPVNVFEQLEMIIGCMFVSWHEYRYIV
jgi:hypothetical protein